MIEQRQRKWISARKLVAPASCRFFAFVNAVSALLLVCSFWSVSAAPQSQAQQSASSSQRDATAHGDTAAQQPDKKTQPSETHHETHQTLRTRAWETLHGGLTENSADQRAKAVNALGLLSGNAEAEKAANQALRDEKYNVRLAAATALGSMHAVRSIPQLESALDDQEPAVVLAAANSLMLLKDVNSAYDVYYGVLTGSVRTNKGLIQEQLRTLHDTKKLAQMGFEEGIGFVPFAGFGYGVAKTVMKSEADSNPVRAAAAKKLAHDPDPRSADALVDATHDKTWMVRAAALEAIAQRGDKSLASKVAPSLDDTKEEVRYTAASCVIHLSDLPARHKEPAASKLAASN
jgi:HEAT repeat protein